MKRCCPRPLPAMMLGVAAAAISAPCRCDDRTPAQDSWPEIVISAARESDAAVTAQVEKALADDPYIYAEHVTVATSNGVVRCGGIVGDYFELFRVLRLCHRFSRSKRVINELEINAVLPDGG